MKLANEVRPLPLFAVLAVMMLAVSVPSTEAATSTGETRARSIISAFSAGDSQKLEGAAKDNYSAALLARRTPEQRAQSLKRIHDEAGSLEIVEVKTSGDTIVATTKGARGGSAIFSFAMGAAPDQRIENLSIQMQGGSPPRPGDDPYKAFAFLIGEWETSGGIRQSLRWGPEKSYIWYAVFVRSTGSDQEHLHQEGMMTFNGKEKDLDFLFVHEPGSLNQEQGKVHVEADGSIVRETTAISADGTVTHFRQTWRHTGPNAAVTSLMRQNTNGTWEPNFSGADKLEMTRRPS